MIFTAKNKHKNNRYFCSDGERRAKHSLSKTVNHDSRGQAPTKQEHHKEKEGGGGGAKSSQRWPTILEECDLMMKEAAEMQDRVRGKNKGC